MSELAPNPAHGSATDPQLPLNLRLARLVRRLALPCILIGGFALWYSYGVLDVPAGMDLMSDTHPPGTRCVVAKHPRALPRGAVVFVDMPPVGTLIARVEAVLSDGQVLLASDNPDSRFADWLQTPVPPAAVRGLVLVAFAPPPQVSLGK